MNYQELVKEFVCNEIEVKGSSPESKELIFLMNKQKSKMLEELLKNERFIFCILICPDKQENLIKISHLCFWNLFVKNYILGNVLFDQKKLFYCYKTNQNKTNTLGSLILKQLGINNEIHGELMFFILDKSVNIADFGQQFFCQQTLDKLSIFFDIFKKLFNKAKKGINFERIVIMDNPKRNILAYFNQIEMKIRFSVIEDKNSFIKNDIEDILIKMKRFLIKLPFNSNIRYYVYFDILFGVILLFQKEEELEIGYFLDIKDKNIFFISNDKSIHKFKFEWFIKLMEEHSKFLNDELQIDRKEVVDHFINSIKILSKSKINFNINQNNFCLCTNNKVIPLEPKGDKFICETLYDESNVNYFGGIINYVSKKKKNRIGKINIHQKTNLLFKNYLNRRILLK